jgi:hypothetical protein
LCSAEQRSRESGQDGQDWLRFEKEIRSATADAFGEALCPNSARNHWQVRPQLHALAAGSEHGFHWLLDVLYTLVVPEPINTEQIQLVIAE